MLKSFFLQSRQSFFLLIYFGVMPSLLGSTLAGFCLKNASDIQNLSFGLLFSLNFLASFGLGLGFMPTTFYSLLGGYLFGWNCLPFLVFSYLVASSFGYWFCGLFDQGKLIHLLSSKYKIEPVLNRLSTSGILLASLCRMSPTLPFAILNAIFAMVKFPFRKYMIGSIIGMLPRTVFAVYIGASFTNVHRISDLKSDYSTWFAIGLGIFSFAGIGWIIKRKLA